MQGVDRGCRVFSRSSVSATALLGSIIWLPEAIAQTTTPSPVETSSASPEEANQPQLEDIIVQARRNSELQQRVPVAITTVTADRLQNATASSTADIQRLIPSLQVTQGSSGQQDFIIRGAPAGFGNDPAVVTYIDDVPIDPRTIVYTLFDLNSVQALKGPQGTLFGRNSTGGAVLFFAKRPDLGEAGGYLSGRYGNLDDRRIEGALNLPITPQFGVRVSGQLQRRDALVRSIAVPELDYGYRRNEAIRVSALWEPGADFENYTQFTHYRQRERHMPQIIQTLAGPCTGPATPAPACLYQPPFSTILRTGNVRAFFDQERTLPGDRTVNNAANLDHADRDAITNTLTKQFGGISFRNTLYWGSSSIRFTKDYDGTPVSIFDQDQTDDLDTFYTESQLFGTLFADRLDWRIGGVYSNDRIAQTQITNVFPLPVSISQPRRGIAAERFLSYALFGQATYDFSDIVQGVSITAGVRHTWDRRSLAFQIFQGQPAQQCGQQTLPVPASGAVPFPGTDLATCTRDIELRFDDTNYNLTLDWKPTDDLLFYATTRRGYKAGGFNLLSTRADLTTYQPETVTDIEAGAKADWKIGTIPFRTNIALFRSRYTNIQSSTVLINPATGDINVVVLNQDPVGGLPNKATIKGFEVEVSAVPVSWLRLSGFYSYTDAKYTQFIVPGSGIDLAGAGIANVIPQTYGATAQVDVPVAAGPFEAISATIGYFGTTKPLVNVTIATQQPRREALDARLALRNLFDSGADLAVYGRNLTDFNPCISNTSVSGATSCSFSDPRTYGLELTFRFGGERR